eukprot:TRINITY_DN12110_c0_g1_i4.p1 TRINITY_DN12110_c0_g1~~TRINITY_DN12110_c0_g1_i4.p1  ORF type:complete len:684 (-),score=107.59 TRINITY_DN12110_c0_g1_i4:1431-3482(-)
MARFNFLVFIATLCFSVQTQPQQQSVTQGNVKDLSVLINNLGASVSNVISEILNQQFLSGSSNFEEVVPSLATQIGESVVEEIMQYSNVLNFEGMDLDVMLSSITAGVEEALTSNSFDTTQDTNLLIKQISNTVLRNIGASLISVTQPPTASDLTLTTKNEKAESLTPTQQIATDEGSINIITAIQDNKISEVVNAFKSIRNDSEVVQQGLATIVCATEDQVSVLQAAETLQAMISNEMIDLVADMFLGITNSGDLCNLPQILVSWLLSDEALVRIQVSLPIEDIVVAQGCSSTIFGLLDEVRVVGQSSGQLQKINEQIDTFMPSVKNCSLAQPEIMLSDEQPVIIASPQISVQNQPTQVDSPTPSQIVDSPLPFQIGSGLPIPTIPPLSPLQPITAQSPLPQNHLTTTSSQASVQQEDVGKQQQSFVWSSSGSRVMVGDCFDIPPPGQYTCEEEASMGKCDRQWMVDGVLCAKTCGICDTACIDIQPDESMSCNLRAAKGDCDSQLFKENGFCRNTCNSCEDETAPTPTLIPVPAPPSSPLPIMSGTPKTEIKVPETQLMEDDQRMQTDSQGVNLVQQAAGSYRECTDIPPDVKFTCQQQKQMGKCNYAWMLEQNFCQISCGRCGVAAADEGQKKKMSSEQMLQAVIQEITQQISNDTSICSDSQDLYSMVEGAVKRGMSLL